MFRDFIQVLAAALFVPLTAVAVSAQNNGIDPPVDGRIVENIDLVVTLSDGYQTRIDVRYPVVAPNPGGWPVVVVVHGGGSNKSTVAGEAELIARQGFATVTFDVRGQGDSMLLNNPSLYGRAGLQLRDRIDLAEVLEAADGLFPDEIDIARAGVTGQSQGAAYSWIAAAHSGKQLPPNPWRTQPFPVFSAVVPRNFIADLVGGVIPGGTSISEAFVRNLFDPNKGTHHEPSYFALIESLIRSEDFDQIKGLFASPEVDIPTLLETSSVPVMASLAYDDRFVTANSLLSMWNNILPNAPKKLSLTTSGHSTPNNEAEFAMFQYRRDMWFAHYLKQVQNDVENLPNFRFAITPVDPTRYADVTSLWDVREFDTYPPAGAGELTWYLAKKGTLDKDKAGGNGTVDVQHVEVGSATIDDYLALLPYPNQLQQALYSLDTEEWVSDPFDEDTLIIGPAVADLWVESDDPNFQIHVALFEEPSGRYLQGGILTVRDSVSFDQAVAFEIGVQGMVIPAGSSLRLQVENLAWHRPWTINNSDSLHALPVFEDFTYKVRMGRSEPSRLRVPTVPLGAPTLIASEGWLRRGAPNDVRLTVHSSSDHAGWTYEILASTSGTFPGHVYSGVDIPINYDWLTERIQRSPGSLPISGFTGVLDSHGRADASMLLSRMEAGIPNAIKELDLAVLIISPDGQTKEVSKATVITVPDF